MNSFDPGSLNDPLALNISWTPIRRGGSGGRTRKCVKVGVQKIEFRTTFLPLLIPGAILLAGSLVLWAGFSGPAMDSGPIILGFFSIFVSGAYLWFQQNKAVFDQQNQIFFKTRRGLNAEGNLESKPQSAAFDQIHALQLIPECVRIKNRSTFRSYELNLVLKDKQRINILDHGDLASIRKDAATLAGFIGIPVWDALGQHTD